MYVYMYMCIYIYIYTYIHIHTYQTVTYEATWAPRGRVGGPPGDKSTGTAARSATYSTTRCNTLYHTMTI